MKGAKKAWEEHRPCYAYNSILRAQIASNFQIGCYECVFPELGNQYVIERREVFG